MATSQHIDHLIVSSITPRLHRAKRARKIQSKYSAERARVIHDEAWQTAERIQTEWSRCGHMDQLRLLPFVDVNDTGQTRFWRVKSEGNYALDCELGMAYGFAYLKYVAMGGTLSLYWIVESMGANDSSTRGIAVGFMDLLLQHLGVAARNSMSNVLFERASSVERTVSQMVTAGQPSKAIEAAVADISNGAFVVSAEPYSRPRFLKAVRPGVFRPIDLAAE